MQIVGTIANRFVGHTSGQVRFAIAFVVALVAAAFVFVPAMALAQQPLDPGLTGIDTATGLSSVDPRVLIARVLRVLLGFLGILAVGIIMYGGWLWMTAAGNADQIDTARKVLVNATIGLVIILSAFTIVSFILNQFLDGQRGQGGGGTVPGTSCINCFAIGAGPVEDHYPERNGVAPRNTPVIITFKERMYVGLGVPSTAPDADNTFILNAVGNGDLWPFAGPSSICNATFCGSVNPKIFQLTALDLGPIPVTLDESQMMVTTDDLKTFSFSAKELLGREDRNTAYRALVTTNLKKEDPQNPGAVGDEALKFRPYQWPFTVSTEIDTEPPYIVSVYPPHDDTDARNTTVTIDFNEAMHPMAVTGRNGQLQGISVFATYVDPGGNTVTQPVEGSFELSNGYRKIELLPDNICATNSCNQPVFCLPANAQFDAKVSAAELWSDTATPTCDPDPLDNGRNQSLACRRGGTFNGATDVAGNSLDGEYLDALGNRIDLAAGRTGDGVADGPPVDSFDWQFFTDDRLIIGGLRIEEVLPTPDSHGAHLEKPIMYRFNRRMKGVKAYPDHLNDAIIHDPAKLIEDPTGTATELGHWFRQEGVSYCSVPWAGSKSDVDADDVPDLNDDEQLACSKHSDCTASDQDRCGKEVVNLKHEPFLFDKEYEPRISSTVKDVYQNCFYRSVGPAPNSQLDGNPTVSDFHDATKWSDVSLWPDEPF